MASGFFKGALCLLLDLRSEYRQGKQDRRPAVRSPLRAFARGRTRPLRRLACGFARGLPCLPWWVGWFSLTAAASMGPSGAQAQPHNKPDLSPTAAAHSLEVAPLSVSSPSPTRAEKPKENVTSSLPVIEDPELPGLVRNADGSYRFQGTNFSATISKDGQVSFREAYLGFSRRMTPIPPPPRDHDPTPNGARYQRSTPWLALQFRIDLHGYIESRLGNDPYLSERRWFMERTQALRDSLGERALTQTLRTTLLKIWSDAGLGLASRKLETFEL